MTDSELSSHPRRWDPHWQQRLEQLATSWQPEIVGTLVFVKRADEVLLIRKKRGHGAGKINGPGGKVEPGETPIEGARRELLEEVGLTARTLQERARIKFIELDGPQWFGHIYTNTDATGTATETDEAIPMWFPQEQLPLEEMWPDDAYWLPQVLSEVYLEAQFLFRAGELLAADVRTAADEQQG